jgi:PAS domain S-box-containing protein
VNEHRGDAGERTALVKVIIDAVPGGIVHVAVDGSIVEANAEALRILGYRYDDLTRSYITAFETTTINEDGSPCPLSDYPVAQVLATGKPNGPRTIGVVRADGETSWAVFRALPARDEAGALTGAIVTFIDITERKRAEEALLRSEAAWRSLAENLPDVVSVVDRDARIRSINRALPDEQMAMVIGVPAYSFVDPDFRDEWRARFEASFETARPVTFETRVRGPVTAYRWFEVRLVPIQEGGRIDRLLVVAHDVTDRRAIVAQLAERERLASIGMLSASVAHEIMNPLTSVLAHLDFAMSERCPPGARQMMALRDARDVAARMQQIVRDLRTLGRRDTAEFFYVDVRSVVEAALRLAGPEIARNIDVRVDLTDVPDVLASESRLCQVLINLLLNAAQALAERCHGERAIVVRTRLNETGSAVGIDVIDTGTGIPPEHMSRIFEPFFTTKSTGTGLGLSISKACIDQMGGRLDVDSRRGVGTTVTVWLSTTRVPTKTPG